MSNLNSTTSISGHRILRLDQVKSVTGLSRSSIYAFVHRKTFPAPVNLGERSVGWLEHEIDNWIEQRIVLREKA